MQVFVNVSLKKTRALRGRRQSTHFSGWFNVVRLIGPEKTDWYRGHARGYVWADIEIGDDLVKHVDAMVKEDGTVRVQVWVNTHRKTLAPVLPLLAEEGAVINVREMGL